MSDSDEDDKRKAEPTSRMWVESQPGPSRCQPSRRGYCGYCRILYNNLDQHLSSLKHLDSVQASSRDFSTTSQSHSSRAKLNLLERFLQDVQQHHPHLYKDLRPSHADLPFVSTPPSPKEELDELCFSNNDSRSLGTREHLPSSDDASCQLTSQQEEDCTHSQSGQGLKEGVTWERASAPKEQEEGERAPTGYMYSAHAQTSPLHMQAPLPVHRKAHRKTNRRKTSDSSSSPPPHRGLDSPAPSEPRPWLSWQRERREAQKKEAFSSDHTNPVGQTIEEVIQMCCYGISSAVCQQEEAESIHFSLPGSMETQSDDWDSPVQLVLQQRQILDGKVPSHTPVLVTQMEEQDVSNLMDTHVDLEDRVYSYQLDSALNSKQNAGGKARKDEGFWTLPVDKVLPTPAYIPESFRGKSWAQIEQEDEEKVDKLVQQFRQEKFICYFDSESLARYGRRSKNKKGCGKNIKVESDTGILPLLDCDKDDSAFIRRRRRRKRRAFRVASRCQVVKVSHSTQTVRLVVPAVHQLPSEAPPPSVPAASQDSAERTPDVQTWQCLPSSYLQIITPLQPRTTLVYLLCSPSGSTPTFTSAPKRCRKKRRPLDLQGFKFKYKQLPVRFYDPSSNQILKNLPKGVVLRRGSSPPPPCVRQLFRSLSPDLNTDRQPIEGTAGSSRVKGHRSDATFSHSFHPSTLSRDSAQTDKQGTVRRRGEPSQAPSSLLHGRAERSVEARNRPCPPASKRRTRAQATPTQPRREGLRRAGPDRQAPSSMGPPQPLSPCRGRTRKGRGSEKSRR